ncbi:MAG: hypothetical protein P8Y23_04910 [Candidatus Lokiarchaeota archaeon]
MNKNIQDFARNYIKDGLKKLPERCTVLFKKMYANGCMTLDIETVVNKMPDSKLDWAMQQIERSIEIEERKKGENNV